MSKPVTHIDETFDFGFTGMSESELREREARAATAAARTAHAEATAAASEDMATLQGRFDKLYQTVLPLLSNLSKDDGKDYIHWPNRVEKMREFVQKVNHIYHGH